MEMKKLKLVPWESEERGRGVESKVCENFKGLLVSY